MTDGGWRAGLEPRGQRLGDRPHLVRVGRQALAAGDLDVAARPRTRT